MQPLLLLETPCRLLQPRIFWGRLRLYPEWLLITGMGWHGSYRRRIPLKEIEEVQLSSLYGTASGMTVTLHDGRTIEIAMKGGMLWRLQIEEARRALLQEATEDVSEARIRSQNPTPDDLLEEPEPASPASTVSPPRPAWLDLLHLMQAENEAYAQAYPPPTASRKKAGTRPRRKKDRTEPTADP